MGVHDRPATFGRSPAAGDVHRAASRELLGGDRAVGNVEDEALAALGTDTALGRIASLSPDQADVVLLRVVGDLSVADVARILAKRPGAVRALQHRGLRALARSMEEEDVTP